jgi:hypothetical protein
MKHIPFAALPAAERQALADALLRSGQELKSVCVSKMEPTAADEAQGIATVTGAGWFRSYAAGPGWIGLLERDLLALRPHGAPPAAQSALQNPGDPG